ncbi:MAG TPA: YncE family protein [Puia sp.]|nr:YncE family protein [Puia sp.]
MKKYYFLAAAVLMAGLSTYAQKKSAYHISASFPINSGGGYDYLTVDPASEKLYVSHGSQVNVLNKITGDSIGVIKTEKDVHGIALVPVLGKGYISNGNLNKVLVFDLATNKVLKYVATGKFADGIFYDDFSKKVISCNGMSKNMTVIDPAADTVFATIQLTGWPETAVSHGKGNIYVNNAEKGEMDVIDANTFTIVHNWPNKPGTGASGLAIDREHMLLFATCGNKLMIVMDARSGKVITSLPTGDGADGAGFDDQLKTAYSSNGDGTLTVVKELSEGSFVVAENVATRTGARTIAVDQKTHKIYLPSGSFKPATKESFRPQIIPGTFRILVVEPQPSLK